MKQFSDMMKNGAVKCSKRECAFNYKGKCCHFASSNEKELVNSVCCGKVLDDKTEPISVGYFRIDLSAFSDVELMMCSEYIQRLSYAIQSENTSAQNAWKILVKIQSILSTERAMRDSVVDTRKKERESRRAKGEVVATSKKKVVKPVKARKVK